MDDELAQKYAKLTRKLIDLPSRLLCPISTMMFSDPVICVDGYTYERSYIEGWLSKKNTSPITNLPLPSNAQSELINNLEKRSDVASYCDKTLRRCREFAIVLKKADANKKASDLLRLCLPYAADAKVRLEILQMIVESDNSDVVSHRELIELLVGENPSKALQMSKTMLEMQLDESSLRQYISTHKSCGKALDVADLARCCLKHNREDILPVVVAIIETEIDRNTSFRIQSELAIESIIQHKEKVLDLKYEDIQRIIKPMVLLHAKHLEEPSDELASKLLRMNRMESVLVMTDESRFDSYSSAVSVSPESCQIKNENEMTFRFAGEKEFLVSGTVNAIVHSLLSPPDGRPFDSYPVHQRLFLTVFPRFISPAAMMYKLRERFDVPVPPQFEVFVIKTPNTRTKLDSVPGTPTPSSIPSRHRDISSSNSPPAIASSSATQLKRKQRVSTVSESDNEDDEDTTTDARIDEETLDDIFDDENTEVKETKADQEGDAGAEDDFEEAEMFSPEFEEWKRKIRLPQQVRICALLLDWIVLYFDRDFRDSPPLFEALLQFVRSLDRENYPPRLRQLGVHLLRAIDFKCRVLSFDTGGASSTSRGYGMMSTNSMMRTIATTSAPTTGSFIGSSGSSGEAPAPKLPVSRNLFSSSLSILDVDDEELARQLTLIDFDLFSVIPAQDFISLSWNTRFGVLRAPNIRRYMSHFDRLSIAFTWMIVRPERVKSRARMMSKLLRVAGHLAEMRNYSSLMLINQAMNHESVHRLKYTKELVGKENEIQKLMDDIVGPGTFAPYRKLLHTVRLPAVPYLSCFLSDLVGISETMPDTVNSGHINWSKYVRMNEIVNQAREFQTIPFNYQPIIQIQKLFRAPRTIPARELLEISKRHEPVGVTRSNLV